MLLNLLTQRESGHVAARQVRGWREDVVRTLGRFELPIGGGGGALVWVLGTKHKWAFLRRQSECVSVKCVERGGEWRH